MPSEFTMIRVERFRDTDGNPTCAADFLTGKVCQFYRTQRFGCHETCLFAQMGTRYGEKLKRRNEGTGYLVPLQNCPVWENENLEEGKDEL